jgi:hypothetical protein
MNFEEYFKPKLCIFLFDDILKQTKSKILYLSPGANDSVVDGQEVVQSPSWQKASVIEWEKKQEVFDQKEFKLDFKDFTQVDKYYFAIPENPKYKKILTDFVTALNNKCLIGIITELDEKSAYIEINNFAIQNDNGKYRRLSYSEDKKDFIYSLGNPINKEYIQQNMQSGDVNQFIVDDYFKNKLQKHYNIDYKVELFKL